MKTYQMTLEQFTAHIKSKPLQARIFENDDEIKTQWLIEIEYAIDDGATDISEANLAAFDAKPSDWLKTK